jgi:hypothetical protein
VRVSARLGGFSGSGGAQELPDDDQSETSGTFTAGRSDGETDALTAATTTTTTTTRRRSARAAIGSDGADGSEYSDGFDDEGLSDASGSADEGPGGSSSRGRPRCACACACAARHAFRPTAPTADSSRSSGGAVV